MKFQGMTVPLKTRIVFLRSYRNPDGYLKKCFQAAAYQGKSMSHGESGPDRAWLLVRGAQITVHLRCGEVFRAFFSRFGCHAYSQQAAHETDGEPQSPAQRIFLRRERKRPVTLSGRQGEGFHLMIHSIPEKGRKYKGFDLVRQVQSRTPRRFWICSAPGLDEGTGETQGWLSKEEKGLFFKKRG
jgi:hypothetical protein